jgi:SecD/SecF fusion protein
LTDRRRNLAILTVVAALLAAAGYLISSQPTVLGLDLRGGVELVYEGRPTPKVPQVTEQALDDSLETIRKRTDALGVSEPEIQRAGPDQISIGLPDVKNADRAVEQVGTTAQLHFYDWEPNVLGERGPDAPFAGSDAYFDAVEFASKQKPRAEGTDIPPDGVEPEIERRFDNDRQKIREFYDRRNDTQEDQYYLFNADDDLVQGPDTNCEELLADFEPRRGEPRKPAKGSECKDQLRALGPGGPPAGSKVFIVPQGVRVIEAERAPNQPEQIKRLFVIEDDSELSGDQVRNPEQNFDQAQQPIVSFDFTDDGRKAFARVTGRIAERGSKVILPPGADQEQALQRFAITLDDEIVSLATIDFREFPEGLDGRGGASIENIGTIQDAQDLAENLRIGALPIDLELISQTQVSASLGQQALDQGLLAAGVGLLLTILFLIVFYRVLGLVATVALLIYAVFLFALVKLIPITLTLPGIAGLVLTLAVAADANIVLYERIKEEVRAGRSIPAGIAAGYSKALRTIIDANVVTIGVAFILFTLATAGVKGFAFTLGIGTIVSLFTAVLATSAILGSMARSRLLGRPSALGAGKERVSWSNFDFTGKSRWFFSVSGVILMIGALAIAGKGIDFGIDFESGTRITAPLQREASVDDVRNTLDPLGYGDAKVQTVDDPELGDNVVQIATPTLQPPQVNEVRDALDEDFGVAVGDFSSNSIGPTFGEQIAQTAVIAVIASLLLIAIYIGIRFEFKFAVPVMIALAHDLLITAGVYSLADRELTTATVAALLTIMGYSLYDTIIVFDRIRENVPRMPRATFSQIANRSMSEVLTRSLATSFTVLMPVGALLLFGGETLKDFAFALLVGVASGAYSSIFIATPVLVEWKERELVYMRRRRVIMQEHGGLVPAFATGVIGEAGATAAAAAPSAPGPAREPRRRRAARAGADRTPTRQPRAAPGGDGAPGAEPARREAGAPGGADAGTTAAPGAADAGAAGTPPGAPGGAPATSPRAQPAPPTPPPGAEPPAPQQPAPARPPDGGDGGAARRESPVSSTAGARKPKQKPKRRGRPKKKHGRR